VRKFLGYIRVSTAKQGEHGVSLQEQRDAIERYASRNNFEIAMWFEERETAAKRGRPVFNQMLKLLRQGKADGVVIHKIDRSARNLKDWADLGELIDQGIDIHFVNESLDLNSRGGRLSADIQAVVAADYIRNLREEARKGFYGRIKQGLFPLPAPLGYLDKGQGQPKVFDPVQAPLVRKTFELYGSGRYNLHQLSDETFRLGLRNRRGNRVTLNGLSVLLNNPFYIGLIKLKSTGELFPGAHEPLIPKSLFDRVQHILNRKTNTRSFRHDFLFRRLITCRPCGYSLIGEAQKGYTYYRCHTRGCLTTCIREETIEEAVLQTFSPLQFSVEERMYINQNITQIKEEWRSQEQAQLNALQLRLGQTNDRLARLTDAYLDQMIDRDIFESRKSSLLMEQKDTEEAISSLKTGDQFSPNRLADFLELSGSAYYKYKSGLCEEKRDLLRIATSNRLAEGKSVDLTLSLPFYEVANRFQYSNGGPYRDIPRTVNRLLGKLRRTNAV